MYRTGGGRSDAPDFNDVEEKVLSICSNITGLEARNDSDTISALIPVQELVHEPGSFIGIPEEQINTLEILEKAENEDDVQTPNMNESIVSEIFDNGNDSQKENKWEKWQPKALKSRVADVLKPSIANKASVTSKLDKLSEARLELVKLQMETTREQHKFVEEEYKLKILHLANDERRKEEIHKLLMEKIRSGPAVPSDIA